MKNLSELKKYLAFPGAAVRVIAIDWLNNNQWFREDNPNPNFEFAKTITTGKAILTDNSQIDFGQACEWAFDNSTAVMVKLSGGHRITYKWANVAIIGEGVKVER